MAEAPDFSKFVPGFDFLQGLMKNAGSTLPNIGQWVAPTLNPEEIEKRIGELRTIQFWLEQNGRMMAATIQALEVQRMTLSTLKTMNVQMGDLRDSLTARLPGAPAPEPDAAPSNWFTAALPKAEPPEASAEAAVDEPATGSANAPRAIDPMQWWGALTSQFAQLANAALKDGPGTAQGAGAMMKQSMEAAGEAIKRMTPGAADSDAAAPARKSAARPARKRVPGRKRSGSAT